MPPRVNDLVHGERAHAEIDALLRELRRAVGLGGRDRPTRSDANGPRSTWPAASGAPITAVTDQAPVLGTHLAELVRTGGQCIYLPRAHGRVVVDGRFHRHAGGARPSLTRTERIVPSE